jgi:hypothetical protein
MTTGPRQFPQRALLLGTLWFPITFFVLWACAALGLWSSQHMETPLAVFFAALFLFAFTLQITFVVRALALLRTQADLRLAINYILLIAGVVTAVLAACFAVLFGVIAVTN